MTTPTNAEANLEALGLSLPKPVAPLASYVPYVQTGSLLFVSGQIARAADGTDIVGQLGTSVSLELGQEAAKLCALNLLAQVKAATGSLDRVTRVVKLTGFVNASADFTQHPAVINAASELMQEVFGDRGQHARAAVGSVSLPFNVAVEIDGIFEVD